MEYETALNKKVRNPIEMPCSVNGARRTQALFSRLT